jgi:eukaryotic-like serine/threonine-protein kinase
MYEELSTPSERNQLIAGRYRLDGLLGIGSMADVHLAQDIQLLRPVAIKLFRPDVDPLARQRFGGEARVLAHLSHPGLVGIYDAGIDGAQPYLVMQLIPGQSLRSRLLAGPLAPAEVIGLGTSLTTAIDHVHRRGIVHRDIKPSNILLDTEGSPHLVDFGIALLVGAVRLTNVGEIVGTAAYLAPEQVLGADIASPTDIYALGLVLLECLTGELAYPGASHVESALARLHRPPDIPSLVPQRLAALLVAMTDTDVDRRPTARQCGDALRLLASSVAPSPVVATTFAGPPDRPRRRSRPYLVGAGVLAAAVAGLVLTLGSALGQSASAARSAQSTSRTVSTGQAAARILSPAVSATVAPTTAVPVTVVVARAPRTPVFSAVPRPTRTHPSGKGHGQGGGKDGGKGSGKGNGNSGGKGGEY